jgi:hypothetical protein
MRRLNEPTGTGDSTWSRPSLSSWSWGIEPVGRIDQGKADWPLEAVALAPPKTGSAIIRHVVIEAPSIDEAVALRPRPSRETRPTTLELAGAP